MKNIVILGKFDGIHIGHTALISAANDISEKTSMKIIVYTIGTPMGNVITQREERNELLISMGADEVIERELDSVFRNMMPDEFVNTILKDELCAGYVIVGGDFRFGKDRCSDVNELRFLCSRADIQTVVIDNIKLDMHGMGEEVVSSSDIRSLVESGNVRMAKEALGRCYSIRGEVKHGKHLGTKLGFPTLNIYPDKNILIPRHGVYATRVLLEGKLYNAITNVGYNPTVEQGENIKIETHIIDYNDSCYGKTICVYFEDFIRGEIKFNTVDELKNQVLSDINTSRKTLECI